MEESKEDAASAGAGGEEEDTTRVSWNPKAIQTTYEVHHTNPMRPYPERVPRNPADVKLTKDKLIQRVFKDKPSRDIQVKRLEKHFREGVPCDKREELISAFNNLMGLEKTIDQHVSIMDSFYKRNKYDDPVDEQLRQELVQEIDEAREYAKALMRYCGFKGMLRFGKILKDPNVSKQKQHKIKRLMDLLT